MNWKKVGGPKAAQCWFGSETCDLDEQSETRLSEYFMRKYNALKHFCLSGTGCVNQCACGVRGLEERRHITVGKEDQLRGPQTCHMRKLWRWFESVESRSRYRMG